MVRDGTYGMGYLCFGVVLVVLWRGTCRTGLLVVVICCNP